jgi:hypothetical protein
MHRTKHAKRLPQGLVQTALSETGEFNRALAPKRNPFGAHFKAD